ncbi:hypothetical protein MNB_SV-10-1345 [hydrothermal vent metagenome]|uniref:DUF4878 domain-containing protein n=1 Tax=hydrothermal vent metagenome TaxID=652676 RepID=A0A1W1CJF3_9ZZZZ
MWKKVVLGVLGFIVLVIGLTFWVTSGLTDNASAFFRKIKAHDYKTAYYAYLSDDFKDNVPFEKFKTFIETNHLDRFKEATWDSRETDGNKGRIEGSLLFENGSSIPITVMFSKSGDEWKIYAIKKSAAGIVEGKENSSVKAVEVENRAVVKAVPSSSEYLPFARKTVAQVADTLATKDSSKLYSNISERWREQISPEKFHSIFSGMIKSGVDLTALKNMNPIEEKPASIDKDGLLNIYIYYPTKPVAVVFDLNYINEYGHWKLFGINIHGKQ